LHCFRTPEVLLLQQLSDIDLADEVANSELTDSEREFGT
jgi:hypothetical protein